MSDRLSELLRQRAALQEHLAWLDREIANAAGSPLPAESPLIPPSVPPAAATSAAEPARHPPTAAAAAPAAAGLNSILPGDAESILDHYRTSSGSLHRDVRQGCFLYFALALGLLALVVLALYFAIGSR